MNRAPSDYADFERLEVILQNIHEAILAADAGGRVSLMNPRAEALTGWRQDQAQGRDVAEVLHLLDDITRQPLESPIDRVLQDGVISRLPNPSILVARDGQEIRINGRGTPVRGESGQVSGAVLVFGEFSQGQQTADALQTSEARLAGIINSAMDAIITLNARQRIIGFNAAAERMFHCPAAKALGKRIDRFIPERFRAVHAEHIRSFGRTGVTSRSMRTPGTLMALRAGGEEFPIEATISQVEVAGQKLYTVIIRDITDRQRAEEAQRFLAESSTLLVTSLQVQSTLQALARLAVPFLADFCTVYMFGKGGQVTQLAVAHVDPHKEELLLELDRIYKPDPDHPHSLAGRVLRSGEPLLFPVVPPEALAALPADAPIQAINRELAARSILIVPLTARRETFGIITLTFSESGRQYGTQELALAQEFARRAALVVDNARLYEAEQQARQAAERAAARTARLQAVTAALSEELTAGQVARVIVEESTAALGARLGTLAVLTQDGTEIEILQAAGYAPEVVTAYRRFSVDASLPLAEAVRTGEPVLLPSLEARAARYPHLAAAQQSVGGGAIAAVPLTVEGRTIGAMGLNFSEDRMFDDEDRSFVLALARQCAQALERARLREAEHHSQQRLSFLAEATAILASSLDYEATLNTVVHLAVPRFADWCRVDIVEEDGQTSRLAFAHADPARIALGYELERRFPFLADPSHPIARVIHSGQPLFLPEIPEAMLEAAAVNTEHLDILRSLGLQSSIVLPLIARGQPFGALTLVYAESGKRYTRADLEFAEHLARRAATAVDNARLYRDAEHAIRARDRFLAVAAHELRTPLTTVQGYGDLLLRRVRRQEQLAERDERALQAMTRQTARLNKLIADLLDFSRLQTGQLPLEQVPLSIIALVRRVVEEIQPSLERHRIDFDAVDQALIVEGDEIRLEQAVQNLLHNAVKYSPDGGAIAVHVEAQNGMACVSITDQGIGIPAGAVPFVFDRFYRAPNVDLQHLSGMGIGLYIVKEIVERHGGTAMVDSCEGAGSTFTICLPLADSGSS